MDWNSVTVGELLEGLRDVDLGQPRPVLEFFDKLSMPRDVNKWSGRLKANAYYFRTNYIILCSLCYAIGFLRNPLALAGLVLTAIAVLSTNDSFATSLNDAMLRILRRFHPASAARLRSRAASAQPEGSLGPRGRGGGRLYILFLPRAIAVLVMLACAALLVHASSAGRTVAWCSMFGLGLPLLHMSLRSPNLKARLASARDDRFRAMWRGYQMEVNQGGFGGGYTDYSR